MDQEQRITINIAGKMHELNASSEEKEHLMRLAAEEVNKVFDSYNRYQIATREEKLALVALQQAMAKINFRERLEKYSKSEAALDQMLSTYLSTEEVKSR